MPVLLVDRPGHGGNPPLASDRPLSHSVAPIRCVVDKALARTGRASVVILGHSSGGAIALMLASCRGALPLAAVAVSGIGDEPAEEVRGWQPSGDAATVKPDAQSASLFFGPAGSYDWRAPAKLRRVGEPWYVNEMLEILRIWPGLWRDVVAGIDVPVQLRLAEHDRFWRNELEVLDRMASAFRSAPFVNAAILPGGGHLYELHRRGSRLVQAQLDFLETSASGRFHG
jgi:pimeloyl-ACP methyl ester carboxylesterase